MVKRRETYSGLRGEFFSPVWTTKGMASSRGRQDDQLSLGCGRNMCDCECQNIEDLISREEGLTCQRIFQICREYT
jgi:hypothetical protein